MQLRVKRDFINPHIDHMMTKRDERLRQTRLSQRQTKLSKREQEEKAYRSVHYDDTFWDKEWYLVSSKTNIGTW